MHKESVNLTYIDRDEDFSALRDSWNALLTRSSISNIFLTWEWLYTWWQHFNADRQLAIMLIKDHDHLVGIAPFFREKTLIKGFLPISSLRWLGTGDVGSDYLNIIIEHGYEEAVTNLVCNEISDNSENWDLLWLSDLPEDSECYATFLAHFTKSADFTCYPANDRYCPYIDLSKHSWDSYFESLSANMRSNLRRRNKQVFNNQYNAEIVLCKNIADVSYFLDEIFALHLQRWEPQGGSDGFCGQELRNFHQEVAERFFYNDWLRLYLLKINGQAVAGIYGMEFDKTFSFYQSGFSPEWEKLSVGKVLMGHTIKDAISRGMSTYDFLHGRENYKFSWANSLRRTCTLMISPKKRLAPKFYFWLRILMYRFSPEYAQPA